MLTRAGQKVTCESGLQVTFSRVISVGTVWINGRSAVRNYKREIVKSYEFQQFGVCFPVFAPLFGGAITSARRRAGIWCWLWVVRCSTSLEHGTILGGWYSWQLKLC